MWSLQCHRGVTWPWDPSASLKDAPAPGSSAGKTGSLSPLSALPSDGSGINP